ncbi:MAG: PIN domain-containing protein [Planctomycetota bacterium]
MRFWDSSAVLPLIVHEQASASMREYYDEDRTLVVWCLTAVEIWSGVTRKRRQKTLGSPDVREARRRLQLLAADWAEVDDIQAVRSRAQRLLEVLDLLAAGTSERRETSLGVAVSCHLLPDGRTDWILSSTHEPCRR